MQTTTIGTDFMAEFPSNEEMQNFIITLESERQYLGEVQEDRWKRCIIDCQDDTIIGGISWNATSDSMYKLSTYMQIMERQIKTRMPEEFTKKEKLLMDMEGNVLNAKLVNGKYGLCWAINDENGNLIKFIGYATKPSTYAKKGYQIANKVTTFERYYLCKRYTATDYNGYKSGLVYKQREIGTSILIK